MMLFANELEVLQKAMKTTLTRGSVVVFQVAPEHMRSLGKALEAVHHILKAHEITAIVADEDTSIIMVPESRRVCVLPRTEPTGNGSTR